MSVRVQQWNDAGSWNRFVASSPLAHFQQSWEWGELVPDFGGASLRLVATQNDSILACMQVAVTPIKYAGTSYFYVPRGPVVAEPTVQILGPLLDAARELGREHGAVGLKVEPEARAGDERWTRQLRALGLRPAHPPSQPRSSWV